MSFLHPGLLLLLPLAVVPIILHLVTLHRLKTIELSTFRFLFDSYFRQHRRVKFAEALLTALRTLFLLFLVLLICRPVMQHWSALFRAGASGEKIIVMDCSASLGARTEGLSALDRAKSAALALIERLSNRERVTLLRVTAQVEELQRSVSPATAALREQIAKLTTAPTRADLARAFKQIFPPGARRDSVATVYLFTDCQATGWRQAQQQGLEQVLPPKTRLYVVDVGSREAVPNRAVIGDPPPARAIVGLPVILKARVVNHSKDDNADVTVKLMLDDHEVTRETVALKPGEERVAELSYIPREAGLLHGRFEIESDRFPEDDSYLFSLPVVPQVRVLLVNGKPSDDPFENETLYLRTALTTQASDEAKPDFVQSLDVRELREPEVTADTLRAASVVILANCGNLTDDQFGLLREFVREGGGLIIFPGDQVKENVYNRRFFPARGPLKERLTTARLLDEAGNPKDARTFARFTALDFRHPMLRVFDHPEAGYLAKVLIYRRFELRTDDTGTARTLAQFSTGTPALVESQFGKGTILLAAFPANAKWSNLPVKPEFVPLVLGMVSYVQRQPDFESPTVVVGQGTDAVSVSKEWTDLKGTLTDPAEHKTALAFQWVEGRWSGALPEVDHKGYYSVEVTGTVAGKPQAGQTLVAVNVPPEESNLVATDETELRRLLPAVELKWADASAQAQQLSGGLGDQREVWRPMIFLLFIVICVEFALATRSVQGRRPGDPIWKRVVKQARSYADV